MSGAQIQTVPSARERSIEQPRGLAIERIAKAIICWSITINVAASMGNFNTALLPAEQTHLQQFAALSMWILLIYASAFVRPSFRVEFNLGLIAIAAFYALATISVLWTNLTAAALMKSAALAMTSFGALRLITRIDIDDIVKSITRGLLVLVAASAFFAVFVPDIGIDHSWMHNGQWQGIFESKQTLGFVGAYLMFFSYYRKVTGQNWLPFLVTFLLASTCVLASESRGAGAVALAACGLLFSALRSTSWMRVYAVLPFVMCIMASFLILYFYVTGYDSIHLFDWTIDFTERTYIWQYAISRFDDAPLLGFGINGFWSTQSIYDYFLQNHGWVLDNYHSGYIAILMETGILGYLLFSASVFLFSNRMLYFISSRSADRFHCALIIVFFVLSFQTNFTETMFLRSTTFSSVLLLAFFLVTFRPVMAEDHSYRELAQK